MKLDISDKSLPQEHKSDMRLNPVTDKIKNIVTNEKGQVQRIIFSDDNVLDFKDFVELFKWKLQTIVAGEIITFEDVWRFSKQTDARSFEMYLDNVEQEGIQKGSRNTLSRPQKTGMIFWIMIIGAVALGLVFLFIVLSRGGKIL